MQALVCIGSFCTEKTSILFDNSIELVSALSVHELSKMAKYQELNNHCDKDPKWSVQFKCLS